MLDIRKSLAAPAVYKLFAGIISTRSSRWELVDDYIRPEKGDRILDIGCGLAAILDFLPDIEYIGFDMEKRYIDAAIKRHGSRGQFYNLRIDHVTTEQFSSMDIALAKGVLHHLHDEEALQLFTLARNALKADGRLITMDGCHIPGRSHLERCILAKDRGRHIRNQEDYYHLATRVFPKVQVHLRHNLLRIPYTHIIMECSL